MRFYNATTFLFPRSYEHRILFVCFSAIQVPLIAVITYRAITDQWQLDVLLVLLAATLLGAVLGLAAIRALLAPIGAATGMLRTIQLGDRVTVIPKGGDDLVGRLLSGVMTAAHQNFARTERLTETAAERDAVTGIRNRRSFLDAAEQILRVRNNAVLAFLDIDDFKSIHDDFGQDTGDRILKSLAIRIEDHLRRSDIAARWGGEKFAVLMADTTIEDARMVLERLRAAVALDASLAIEGRAMTFSFGATPVHTFAELGDATRHADAALYAARNAGPVLKLVEDKV